MILPLATSARALLREPPLSSFLRIGFARNVEPQRTCSSQWVNQAMKRFDVTTLDRTDTKGTWVFFHGEKVPPLATNVVIPVGNYGIYTGP